MTEHKTFFNSLKCKWKRIIFSSKMSITLHKHYKCMACMKLLSLINNRYILENFTFKVCKIKLYLK